jgi:hypothetical protein
MAFSSHVLVHLCCNAACSLATRQPAVLQSKQQQQQEEQQHEVPQQQQELLNEYPVHDEQQQYSCGVKLSDEVYTPLLAAQEHLQQRWGAAAAASAAAASAAAAAGTAHSRGSTSDSELAATKQRLLGLTRPVQQTARTMLSAATAEVAVAGRITA